LLTVVCFGFRYSDFGFGTISKKNCAGGKQPEFGFDHSENLLLEFSWNKAMVGPDAAVGGTKRDAASRAVGDEKPVKGVASPVES
jgi:hypothetical protein